MGQGVARKKVDRVYAGGGGGGGVFGAEGLEFLAQASGVDGLGLGVGADDILDGPADGEVAFAGYHCPLEFDDLVSLVVESEDIGELWLLVSSGMVHSRICPKKHAS